MTRSARPTSTYDDDFFTWTQDQAAALRRMGEHSAIDIENVAEEIGALSKRDLREVESFLRLLLFHLMKLVVTPEAPSVPQWKSEAREFQLSASRSFSPGMRRLIDGSLLWQEAAKRLNADRRGLDLPPLRTVACPYAFDDLLAYDFDLDRAVTRLAGAQASRAGHPR